MRIILTALLLSATVLAGCASEAPEPVDSEDPFEPIDVPDDKGIIRGVVIDQSIVPIAGATIRVEGAEIEEVSAEDGTFVIQDLEPGTYFLSVSKIGYVSAQSSADVVAGEDRPPIMKVQLIADPASRPTVDYFQFDGFMECSFALVAVGFNACGLVSDVGDIDLGETQVRYDMKDVPTWIQTEMIWKSSQPAGDALILMYSYGDCAGFYCDHEVEGTSPLVLTADADMAQTLADEEGQIYIRVFGTETSQAPGTGAGVTLEQEFTHFTSVFYGFQPDEGWLYTVDGPHPIPE